MANRSYLYAVDRIPDGTAPVRAVGVSEWPWDLPTVHLVLVSGHPRVCPSTIWDPPVTAIVAERTASRANLERYLAALPVSLETADAADEARGFLDRLDVALPYLLLEHAEIDDLDEAVPLPDAAAGWLAAAGDADALVRSAGRVRPDGLAAATGRGSWSTQLYFG
ncbi:MAG TPA: hypothetical protein VGE77_08305 [Nocardioides sp.]